MPPEGSAASPSPAPVTVEPRNRERVCTGIHNAEFTYPKSQYEGWESPYPVIDEERLMSLFINSQQPIKDAEAAYYSVDLHQFSIYRPVHQAVRPAELTTLDTLTIEHGVDWLSFDAVISLDAQSYFLQNVSFSTLAIDGYGDFGVSEGSMSLQSPLAGRHNLWYRLGTPAPEYRRYHDIFAWISSLAKFVLEFLDHDSHRRISLHDFRSSFRIWMKHSYGNRVTAWRNSYGSNDFRHAVALHIPYIWKEMFSVNPSLQRMPLWKECSPHFEALKPAHCGNVLTVVTPFVYNIFKEMYFGRVLKSQQPTANQQEKQSRRRALLGLTPLTEITSSLPVLELKSPVKVKTGDTVILKPDTETTWRTSADYWVAYVQNVRQWKDGITTKLDLIWLYKPADTTLREGSYPFQNELFLSDNCSCGSDAYDLQDVVAKVHVSWYCRNPAAVKGTNRFVVRQTYFSDAHEFVTLEQSHFQCKCRDKLPNAFEEAVTEYKPGDFALVRRGTYAGRDGEEGLHEEDILEPVQIVDFLTMSRKVLVRTLLRAGDVDNDRHSEQNELVWTQQEVQLPAFHLVRKCGVRGFTSLKAVPALYRRGGAGDLFYFIYKGDNPDKMSSSTKLHNHTKLRGMGICCGGGSYDRGLEDGGAVDFKHVIDFDTAALHTYRANTDDPKQVNFFLGPMEKYLQDCLVDGSAIYERAKVGEVDVIAAGSPCQGFSQMQPDKQSDKSLKQASLIANVLAYVEHFMPLYVLLENVVGIGSVIKGQDQKQNVLSQALCCLVGLGYQVQQFIIDAPVVGSLASRSRVFVLATAPGLHPLVKPPQTHLTRATRGKARAISLGKLSNGKKLGDLIDDLSPFPMVTFHEGTKDLPDIGDGHVHNCIACPDHRPAEKFSQMLRDVITMIPKSPHGHGLRSADSQGRIAMPQKEKWLKSKFRSAANSRSLTRVRPWWVMNAVTTSLQTLDAFVGECLHPYQDRCLTIMEARRAQGFPDSEVILGTRGQQWRIIGNSVHRNVAFALGLSLNEALEKSIKAVEKLLGSAALDGVTTRDLNRKRARSEDAERVHYPELHGKKARKNKHDASATRRISLKSSRKQFPMNLEARESLNRRELVTVGAVGAAPDDWSDISPPLHRSPTINPISSQSDASGVSTAAEQDTDKAFKSVIQPRNEISTTQDDQGSQKQNGIAEPMFQHSLPIEYKLSEGLTAERTTQPLETTSRFTEHEGDTIMTTTTTLITTTTTTTVRTVTTSSRPGSSNDMTAQPWQ